MESTGPLGQAESEGADTSSSVDAIEPCPGATLGRRDCGDEMQRNVRYQNAYGVIMLAAAARGQLPYTAIWCEHHDDILAERDDGLYDAYQVKTRKPENGLWCLTDEEIRHCLRKFVHLQKQFPRHMGSFSIVSNVDHQPSSRSNRALRSLPKLVATVIAYASAEQMPDTFSLVFQGLGQHCDCSADLLFDVLRRVRIVKGPGRESFDAEIAHDHLSKLPGCEHWSPASLNNLRDELMTRVGKASALVIGDPGRHYCCVNRDDHLNPRLQSKRLSVDVIHESIRDLSHPRLFVSQTTNPEESKVDGLASETQPRFPLNVSLPGEMSARQDHIGAISRLLVARRYKEVIDETDRARRSSARSMLHDDWLRLWMMRAAAFREIDCHDEALDAMQAARADQHDSPIPEANRLLCLYSAGQVDEAKIGAKRALRLWPDEAWVILACAVALTDVIEYDDAIKQVVRATELDGDSPWAWYAAACFTARQGDLVEALGYSERAVVRCDDSPGILNQSAVLQLQADSLSTQTLTPGILARALSRLERANALSDSIPQTALGQSIRLNLAITHLLSGNPGEAVSVLQCTNSWERRQPIEWACLGEAHLLLGDYRNAVKAYREARKLGEADAAVANNLAVGLMNLGPGHISEALRLLRSISDDDPAAGSAHVNLAQCLLERGKPDAALDALYRSQTLGERGWKQSHLRAEALARLSSMADAIAEAVSAVEAAPDEIAPHALLCRLIDSYLTSRAEEVVRALQQLLPSLLHDPRSARGFLARTAGIVDRYVAELSQARRSENPGREMAGSSWRACIECWRTAAELDRWLGVLEGRADLYEAPASREHLAGHLRALLDGEPPPEYQVHREQGRARNMDELVSATPAASAEAHTITFKGRGLDSALTDSCALNRDATSLRGLRLRLHAAHAALAHGFEELRALSASSINLYEHQIRAVLRVLRECEGQALLADEVGLGKTVEAGLVIKECLLRGMAESVLLVVPPTLIEQWREEMISKFGLPFAVWSPSWRQEQWTETPLVIASLHGLKRPEHAALVRSRTWDILVVDEAHHVRNTGSAGWKMVSLLRAPRRLLITATPIHNSLRDLYALVTLARPGTFRSYAAFERDFVDETDSTGRVPKNTAALRRLLANVLVRTRRANTTLELPPRTIFTRRIPMGREESQVYTEVSTWIRRRLPRHGKREMHLYTLLRELCSSGQAAAHTLRMLADKAEQPDSLREWMTATADRCAIHCGSAKLTALETILRNCMDEKVVVFTEFRHTADTILRYLRDRGWKASLLCGTSDKEAARLDFQESSQIMVATEVGAEGLNLQFCRNLVNYDCPWNPMRLEQRIGRVHRIGQDTSVHVYNLVTEGTIEEQVMWVMEQKLKMFHLVIGEIQAVLGTLSGKHSFEATIQAILASAHSEGEVHEGIRHYGERIEHARAKLQMLNRLPDPLAIPLNLSILTGSEVEE